MTSCALLHAIKVAGVDHVGLGIDWDGGAGLVGFEDVSALPRIAARLREEGYSREYIGKIMSGNLLRVMREAEKYAGVRRCDRIDQRKRAGASRMVRS